jgi:hypothetical protein
VMSITAEALELRHSFHGGPAGRSQLTIRIREGSGDGSAFDR